jgi:biopolymer transport protein ExbB/TolQ
MSTTQPSNAAQPQLRPERRWGANVAAFVAGVPLATLLLVVIHIGLRETTLYQYVKSPVEGAELTMFCVALCGLCAKLWSQRTERAALGRGLLPAWDGKPVPVSAAVRLSAELEQQPRALRATFLGRRITAILDFLRSRGSAAELDDHMRALVDNDGLTLDSSFSLLRLITWAIPILGFLGTVLGITAAISNVTPEKLETSISGVTDGLAEAFNATALALGLTMIIMFISYMIERLEQATLEAVDRYADRHLAHRFERLAGLTGQNGDVADVLRQNSEALSRTADQIVHGQAAAFAQVMAEADQRRLEAEQKAQERFGAAVEAALEKTLEAHSRRLAGLEKQTTTQSATLVEKLAALASTVRDSVQEQQATLARIASGLSGQTEALAGLQAGERQLVRLQEVLQQNLAALANTGTFEQAVHSLTAAIHLLTIHSVPGAKRPGMAA